jgi:ATP-dependent DNA ligase
MVAVAWSPGTVIPFLHSLEKWIEASISGNTVLDGEIVCVDNKGRPRFEDLLFRRGNPCFFTFDLLVRDGVDLRSAALVDRKQELRRLLARVPSRVPLQYVDHVEGTGVALFERICELDLEGLSGSTSSRRMERPAKTALG